MATIKEQLLDKTVYDPKRFAGQDGPRFPRLDNLDIDIMVIRECPTALKAMELTLQDLLRETPKDIVCNKVASR